MLWLNRFAVVLFCAAIVFLSAQPTSAQQGIPIGALLAVDSDCEDWTECRDHLCEADLVCDSAAGLCVTEMRIGRVLRCCDEGATDCGEWGACIFLGESRPGICLNAARYCLGRTPTASVRACHTSPDGTMPVAWEDGDCNGDGRTNGEVPVGTHCQPPREVDEEGECVALEDRCRTNEHCVQGEEICADGWCRAPRVPGTVPARCCEVEADCRAGEGCFPADESDDIRLCASMRPCGWTPDELSACASIRPGDVFDCPCTVDGGVDLDAGPPPPTDAGSEVDAGPVVDAGLDMDGGAIDESEPPEGSITGGGGCRCRAESSRGGSGGVALLAMGILLFTRRRR